jgi:methyl-accepting chemotaxis protein
MARHDPLLRPLLWIGAIDLALGLSIVLSSWPSARTGEPAILVVLLLVRMVVWIGHLARLMSPVRSWQRARERGASDEHQLLAADRALQRVRGRFGIGYAVGWALMLLVSLLLDFRQPVSSAQHLTQALSAVAVVIATPALIVPALSHALWPSHTEVANEILASGLRPVRPRTPLARTLVVVFLSLCAAAMMSLGGVASSYRAQARQQQLLGEQRSLAELDALRVQVGQPMLGGGELVTREQLPGPLARLADDEPVTAFDPEAELAMAAAPVGDGRWVVHAAVLDPQLLLTLAGTLVGVASALVPAVFASIALARAVTRPLAELGEVTRRVAETGALDARSRAAAHHNDELGDLAENFNDMLDVFEELAAAASRVAAGDLRVELERPGTLHDAFRSMLSRLDEMVAQIRGTALEVATAASEIHTTTEIQEHAAKRQSTSLSEFGAAVDALASSVESITGASSEVLSDAEKTHEMTELMAARMSELSHQAAGIGELLEQIREIADRSDLLALNGSLEAVRAGEAGRGFALVAAEMRRLAERVTGIVATVNSQLQAIEVASESTELATQQGLGLARNTARTAERITGETSRQRDSAEQLSSAVSSVVEVAKDVSVATLETRLTAEGLQAQAQALERLTKQFETRRSR